MQIASCPYCGAVNPASRCSGCRKRLIEPFVAVYEVGQGNCNALIGADGKILAYFDFGYSTSSDRWPEQQFRPCFCDRPLIILSHWDLDHINLVKKADEVYTQRWLVPEQKHSDFAGTVQGKIKEAGGEMCVFPARRKGRELEHMTFPWGFVERCTEEGGVNGSGLAAFVCVQDSSPAAPNIDRPLSPRTAAAAANGAPAVRARQAVALVNAERITQNGNADDENLAVPLAATLAASQPVVARQPHMPVAECVAAAVRAAMAVRGGSNKAQIVQALNADLATLRLRNLSWANEAIDQLADAALAAYQARSSKAKVRAAASKLKPDGRKYLDEVWSWVGVAAMADPGAALPPIRLGLAPFHRKELFILLNGDANFEYVPSMARPRQPRIAALTAMHHGAVFEDGSAITTRFIPFAPGSHQAKAVVRLYQHTRNRAMSHIALIAAAARMLLRRRQKVRRHFRVAASRAARAAASAILAVEAAHPGEINPDPEKFAAVAAAAAVAVIRRPADAAVAGVAAALASTTITTTRDIDCSPIETVVDLAIAAVAAERAGAPLDLAGVGRAALGALDGDLLPHVITIVADAVANGALLMTADNVGANAATAHSMIQRDYKAGLSSKAAKSFKKRIRYDDRDQDVINDLATAAVAAVLASRRGKRRHSLQKATQAAGVSLGLAGGALATLATDVQAVMRAGYWTPLVGIRDVALNAAKLAAERAVAYELASNGEAVRTVIHTTHYRSQRVNAFRALGTYANRSPSGGLIAYSYGVGQVDRQHEYRAKTAGFMGHPHPIAVRKYEARGWLRRTNTSQRAKHGGPQGDPATRHPRGHISLAWNSTRETPVEKRSFTHRCNVCGKSTTFSS